MHAPVRAGAALGHDMDLQAFMADRRERVERALDELLPPTDSLQKTVVEAMRYSLFAGGKRIRPILCLAGAEAAGGPYDPYVPFACALEMIHTYSLIHDDLPAMDDDDFRRGLPTNHKRFGEGVAVLAGDGLLTEAFAIMTRRSLHPHVDAGRLLDATLLVAEAAGFRGMVGGQVVDLEAEGTNPPISLVEFMHATKTAALIRASVTSGAVLAGADASAVSAVAEYGHYLGLAFQIRDDLLDVIGDSKEMGKPTGSDVGKKKASFPAVVGIALSEAREKEMVDRAVQALASLDSRADPMRALALHLLKRKK